MITAAAAAVAIETVSVVLRVMVRCLVHLFDSNSAVPSSVATSCMMFAYDASKAHTVQLFPQRAFCLHVVAFIAFSWLAVVAV